MLFILATLSLVGRCASQAADAMLDCSDSASTSLLQRSMQKRKSPRAGKSQRSDVLPLKWMHIPKSGTSILNAVSHLPGVCPGIPSNSSIDEDHYGEHFEVGFMSTMCRETCPGLDCHHVPSLTHWAIGAQYEDYYRGHGFAMFRQPEQRAISQYNMLTLPDSAWYNLEIVRQYPSVKEYAEHVEGGVTRMLTEESGEPCLGGLLGGPAAKVPAQQLALAKQRLQEGFVFVGITEHWDLSICLLHAMFGGECAARDFENSRPGLADDGDHSYDSSELHGFVDEADGEIYRLALRIFHENLAKYEVSNESCGACWEQASASAP